MKKTTVGAALAAIALLTACSDIPPEDYRTVTVNGNVEMLVGPLPPGTITFRLYVLEALEGELQHPLSEIEDFTSDSGEFSHTFEYPAHMGTGLGLHAWIDSDGDGIFCTPKLRKDASGMAWTEETPENEVTLTITLTENCRAANWFYPPVQK